MKIKVIKSNSTDYWYAGLIGEYFEVVLDDYIIDKYCLADDPRWLIDIDDAREI